MRFFFTLLLWTQKISQRVIERNLLINELIILPQCTVLVKISLAKYRPYPSYCSYICDDRAGRAQARRTLGQTSRGAVPLATS